MSITKLDTKARIRKGGHIQTRPRGEGETSKARRKVSKETPDHYRDITKSGTFARQAMNEQKRLEISEKNGERSNPYTREEFDAIRREEEQVELDKLRKLKTEYESSERMIRLMEIERRKNGQRENQ